MILDAVFFKWHTELQSTCLDFSQITNHKTIIVTPSGGVVWLFGGVFALHNNTSYTFLRFFTAPKYTFLRFLRVFIVQDSNRSSTGHNQSKTAVAYRDGGLCLLLL